MFQCVLAAIIITSLKKIVMQVQDFKRYWDLSRIDGVSFPRKSVEFRGKRETLQTNGNAQMGDPRSDVDFELDSDSRCITRTRK